MTQPVQGLQKIRGFVRGDPTATPEERSGGTADPRHGSVGEAAKPYPWEQYPGESHGPYGLENELLGMDIASYETPSGFLAQDPTADLQPITHAANWPKGTPTTTDPNDVAAWRQQSAEIHAQNMGGSREALYIPTLNPEQDSWVELWEVDPGVMIPPQPASPEQLKTAGQFGWASRDRNSSNARQNGFGYDAAHMHRRYATGSIPGNYMWLEPGGRPLVKSVPGTALVPAGADSPFAGQSGNVGYDPQGSALMDLPVDYIPPPAPALAPAFPGEGTTVVEYW